MRAHDVISHSISVTLNLHLMEFSDIIVASLVVSINIQTVDFLKAPILQLTFLAEPFPQLDTYTVGMEDIQECRHGSCRADHDSECYKIKIK